MTDEHDEYQIITILGTYCIYTRLFNAIARLEIGME